jgi:hypothetical protein
VLKLKRELDSSKYMIQSLERELMLKNALLEVGGFKQWQNQQEAYNMDKVDYLENMQTSSLV